MIIAIDLTPIYDHLTGVERYNINISKEMIKSHPENEYILVFKNEVHESFSQESKQENVSIEIIPECNKFLFIQWKLYKTFQNIKADYYLFLSFTSPILFKRKGIINAIHDLTCWDCPETIPTKMKYYYRMAYHAAVKNSWKVITVSRFSQNRICKRYGLGEDNVPVIYDGLTEIFRNPPPSNNKMHDKYGLPEKYILSLSTLEPRKNLRLLILAYTEMLKAGVDLPDLVLAGRQGWKLEEVTGEISNDIIQRIHFSGFIDDKDLPQLYRDASLFVFPSIYEGFGLPVIEAMSQGTIVVCSDAASLPEIAGDTGYIFKSNDQDDLMRVIRRALQLTESERLDIEKRGIEISNQFSWKCEAEKLYDIISCI